MGPESKRDRIEAWKEGEENFLWDLQIHPTNRCNLGCRFCWRKEREDINEELEDKKILQTVDEACDNNVKRILFTGGGEPLLRSDLVVKALDSIAKKRTSPFDIESCISTNGTLIDDRLAEKIVRNKLTTLVLSMHGSNYKTDDYLRGKHGAFKKSITAIEMINHWKDKLDMKYPKVTMHVVLTSENFREIKEIYSLVKELNIYGVHFVLVNAYNELQPTGKDVEEIKKYIGEIKRSNCGDVKIKHDFEVKKNRCENEDGDSSLPCAKPLTDFTILSDGTCSVCCVLVQNERYISEKDISDFTEKINNKKLEDVWYSSKIDRLRKAVINAELPPECKEECTKDLKYVRRKKHRLKDRH